MSSPNLYTSTSSNVVKSSKAIEEKKRKRDQLVAERDALAEESRRKIAKYDEDIASLDVELQ